MLRKVVSLYKTLNLLSIDVAVGAICSSYFLASVFLTEVSFISAIVLGFAVWIIYTVDHLLDVINLKRSGLNCSTYRHQFHNTYFNQLRVACIILFLITILLIAFIPRDLIVNGLGLAVIVSAYLLLNSFLTLGKEFIIATCYIVGVVLPSQIEIHQLVANSVFLFSFFITVLFNVVMFSFFDLEIDSIEKRSSFVTRIGFNRVNFLFSILFILQFTFTIMLIPTFQAVAGLTLFCMTSIMFMLVFFKRQIGISVCRIVGEAVFLIPGFYCLIFN